MAEPAAWVLYEMISLIIDNTIGTLVSLVVLFSQLLESIGLDMGSGLAGLLLGLIILGVVGFLLAKFVFSSGKTIIMLIGIGAILLFIIYLGMAMA